MTFTYTPSTPNDITRVRFAIGDTDTTAAVFTDEEITFQISETTTWQRAVIALLESLIARLAATPDFQADWLRVSQAEALKAYQALLKIKRAEYGVATITATAKHTYRPDSNMTEAPTYDTAQDG